MAMQDKDFDKLFNQKFEGFEVEPSPMAWDNIAAELDGKKSTRSVMPWIRVAAAVLIIATAGVLFLKNDTQTNDGEKKDKLVANRVKPVVPVKPEVHEVNEPASVVTSKPKIAKVATQLHKYKPNKAAKTNPIIAVKVTPADITEHDPTINNETIIAAVTNPASTQTQATLPDVQLTPRTLNADPQANVEKPITASTEKQNTEPAKKRGIQSFGGLINAVVAKLDKRDDKLIEFSDGDDGDDNATKLTGVNLGLIKIKKQ